MADLVFGKVAGAFTIDDDGPVVRVSLDEPWEADDPAVVARPEFFKDRPDHVQTSGLPKKQSKRAAKKAAAKSDD